MTETEREAFMAGLRDLLHRHGVEVREIASLGEGFLLWVEEAGTVIRTVQLLDEIPQVVAYRYHPTSEAVLEIYTAGAELPSRGLHMLRPRVSGDGPMSAPQEPE